MASYLLLLVQSLWTLLRAPFVSLINILTWFWGAPKDISKVCPSVADVALH
jgi:hypothetical protein